MTRLDPGDPQVEVTGTAYVCDRSAWGPVPDDLPLETVLEIYDVYGAGSLTRTLAPDTGTICVLGAGHAGKLALAAARDAMQGGTVVAVDVDEAAIARVSELGLCDIGVTADLRDPLAAVEALRAAGAPPADLTVVVVNATGCEPTAILLTADSGTVLFFSMATNFSDRRAGRGRDRHRTSGCWSAAATPRTAAPTRSTWCAARAAAPAPLGRRSA